MSVARGLAVLLLATSVIAGIAWLIEREKTQVLHEQITRLRADRQTAAELEAENERLKQALPPEAELTRLRSDHAALERLERELTALRQRIAAEETAVRSDAP